MSGEITFSESGKNMSTIVYGIICCLCTVIGTLGNMTSFFYFNSKKRDISSVIYMFITINDMVISLTVLPVGISFLSQRQPGILFGDKYGCIAWDGTWRTTVPLSVFLVICLCSTRTVSMLRPFRRQKMKHLLIGISLYLIILLSRIFIIYCFRIDSLHVEFDPSFSRCQLLFDPTTKHIGTGTIFLLVGEIITYTTPAFVVAISCVISVVVLTRKNRNVQLRELQQSRNRATVTILLFALLYGVCNIPLVIEFINLTFFLSSKNLTLFKDIYKFDEHYFYRNAVHTLLLAINSAVNPIFYFWRMPPLREYIMEIIGRVMRPCREWRLYDGYVQTCNQATENIEDRGIYDATPLPENAETAM